MLRPLLLALALAVPTAAHADLAPPQPVGPVTRPGKAPRPPRPGKGEAKGAKREALRQKVHEARLARIVELLGLDAATAKKMDAILTKHEAAIAPIRQEIRTLRDDLAALVQLGKATAAEVNPRLDKLQALIAQRDAADAQLVTEARAILTPEQAAKLVIALPEIDRQLMKKVMGRDGAEGGMPGGGPPGPQGDRGDPWAPGPPR